MVLVYFILYFYSSKQLLMVVCQNRRRLAKHKYIKSSMEEAPESSLQGGDMSASETTEFDDSFLEQY